MSKKNSDITIHEHIAKIYADHELTETATIRNFRTVQNEGRKPEPTL